MVVLTDDIKKLLAQAITQTGPLGILCILVLLELRDMGGDLEVMREHLAVCIAAIDN